MVAGLDFDKEVLKEFYTALSEDIKKQKARIGGDWVIANVAFSRDIRDAIRQYNTFISSFIMSHLELYWGRMSILLD